MKLFVPYAHSCPLVLLVSYGSHHPISDLRVVFSLPRLCQLISNTLFLHLSKHFTFDYFLSLLTSIHLSFSSHHYNTFPDFLNERHLIQYSVFLTLHSVSYFNHPLLTHRCNDMILLWSPHHFFAAHSSWPSLFRSSWFSVLGLA